MSVAPRDWGVAQRSELEWWAERRDQILAPEALERKRLATQEIWGDIRSVWSGSGVPRLLEIGTGGDGFVNFLPGAECVGLEPLVGELKRRGLGTFSPSAEFVAGAGERLPFRTDTFDVVILYNVVDHALDPGAILDEVRRVLCDGGVLHFLVDTYSGVFAAYRKVVPDPMHPHTFTPRRARALLESRGFSMAKDFTDRHATGWARNRKIRGFYVVAKRGMAASPSTRGPSS